MIAALVGMVSVRELAERIGCSERYLRKFARDTGHYRKFGSKMVFLPADIDALMAESKQSPRARDLSGIKEITRAPAKRRSESDSLIELRELLAKKQQKKHPTRL